MNKSKMDSRKVLINILYIKVSIIHHRIYHINHRKHCTKAPLADQDTSKNTQYELGQLLTECEIS